MIVLKIIAAILLVILLALYIWKLVFNCGGKIKLGILNLRKLMTINPEKWEYGSRYWDYFCHLRYNDHVQVKLSFFAFLWFLFYQVSEKKRKHKEETRATMVYILEDCQRDVERLMRQAKSEVDRANRMMKEVVRK